MKFGTDIAWDPYFPKFQTGSFYHIWFHRYEPLKLTLIANPKLKSSFLTQIWHISNSNGHNSAKKYIRDLKLVLNESLGCLLSENVKKRILNF